ncbi:uncharacterized protein LOC111390519 [Olea europaea var. sylvestris]|uniref:uncharacterized protein LOC111390519 n=1 Tax=Olea europaea var. sylvestris TaxID=158386 RepID=UPI000C1CF998|nr:uncharacterized protein LOC111390519 [Olea europaea var. sylvestris]
MNSDSSEVRYKARLVSKGILRSLALTTRRHLTLLLVLLPSVLFWLSPLHVDGLYFRRMSRMSSYMVIWLKRSIYSLFQGILILLLGFASNPYDSALFTRHTDTSITILLLYVDDMIIIGDDNYDIHELKQFLCQHFEMKDLGSLSYFLNLEESPTSDDCKIADSLLEPNIKLRPTDRELLPDATHYQQLVGSLIYLTVTRLDIAYAVHLVSQFMSAPRSIHHAAVLCILHYVKGTLFHGFHFSSHSSLTLKVYFDADWAGDPTDRRSTIDFLFLLGDSFISSRSKKQTVVARSSTEAEY